MAYKFHGLMLFMPNFTKIDPLVSDIDVRNRNKDQAFTR
jgi:hypothetical protein